MKKILTIVKWEVFQRIKNRLFIFTLIITPLLVVGIGAASGLLSESGMRYTKVVGIKNIDAPLFNTLSNFLESEKLDDGQPAFIAVNLKNTSNYDRKMVDLILNFKNDRRGYRVSVKKGLSISPVELETVKRIVQASVANLEFSNSGTDKDLLKVQYVFPKGEENRNASYDFDNFFFTSFAFLFLLIVIVIFSGSNFVRVLLEEKSTHIIEILLSSSSPSEIIVGKYIGLITIGLIQTVFWFGISYIFFSGNSSNIQIVPNYPLLILYFGLGYLLYTAIYLAFGIQVSSESDSQQVTSLISLFLLVPIILSTQILLTPNSFLTTLLTYFPLTTSPIMLIKVNIYEVGTAEILVSVVIQLISIAVVFGLSTNYFTKGLMQFERKKRNKK